MNSNWWLETFFKTDPGIHPFYEDGRVVLFNCDCKELMPNMKDFDLLISDPPYGQNWKSNHRIVQFEKIIGDEAFDYDTLRTLIKMSTNGAFAFCRWDNLMEFPKDLKPKSFLTWVKNNWGSGDLNAEFARQTESVAFWPKGGHKWANGRPTDVFMHDRVASAAMVHPSEKPEGVFGYLLDAVVGETVFDPYCGSGASLRAAKARGKKAIGCELVLDYCEKAADRCRQDFLL